MASVLSPLAEPFHPLVGVSVPNAIIYNDGVPCLAFQGSESEFLHFITDETIDEVFPPDAQEAAEIEAMEIFVDLMANLSYLEEREEAARSVEHTGLKKRWEARRELEGRPRPAKHSVSPAMHDQPRGEDVKDLATLHQSCLSHEHRMRQREISRLTRLPKRDFKATVLSYHQKPIQQPRKHS
jgi:hypothetical protein